MQRKELNTILIEELEKRYQALNERSEKKIRAHYNDCIQYLKEKKYIKARTLYHCICQQLPEMRDPAINKLFLSLIHEEDFITQSSTVLIEQHSPFYKSLDMIAKKLGFHVTTHSLPQGTWTKDYVISTGNQVFYPAHQKKLQVKDATSQQSVRDNNALYYGKVRAEEHHFAKTTVSYKKDWQKATGAILENTLPIKDVVIEGGNFFCAVNRRGVKYYLIGENAISETTVRFGCGRQAAITLTASNLGIGKHLLLVIPQWTYHLDLQMAYVGYGRFLIHSFDQSNFDFDLSKEVQKKVETTFKSLCAKFEKDIINSVIQILVKHDFDVLKMFGCLFYLNDVQNITELQYVPYCKHSETGGGSIAFMMNGISGVTQFNERFFLTSRCDNEKFKKQFEEKLKSRGIMVQYIDMLDFYDGYGWFDGLLAGNVGTNSVTEYVALMNGGLRCQTSIVPMRSSVYASNLTLMSTAKTESKEDECKNDEMDLDISDDASPMKVSLWS